MMMASSKRLPGEWQIRNNLFNCDATKFVGSRCHVPVEYVGSFLLILIGALGIIGKTNREFGPATQFLIVIGQS